LMTDVVQHADVRMIQAGDGFRFTLEALFAYWIGGKLRRQNLDRHSALKAHVPRTVDLAHAARAQRRKDFIRPEATARVQRHLGWIILLELEALASYSAWIAPDIGKLVHVETRLLQFGAVQGNE
jgi:hypothetical protein